MSTISIKNRIVTSVLLQHKKKIYTWRNIGYYELQKHVHHVKYQNKKKNRRSDIEYFFNYLSKLFKNFFRISFL